MNITHKYPKYTERYNNRVSRLQRILEIESSSFTKNEDNIKEKILVKIPTFLIINEITLILKAYYGSIFKFIINYLKSEIHTFLIRIKLIIGVCDD